LGVLSSAGSGTPIHDVFTDMDYISLLMERKLVVNSRFINISLLTERKP